jgi:hypothetical protein
MAFEPHVYLKFGFTNTCYNYVTTMLIYRNTKNDYISYIIQGLATMCYIVQLHGNYCTRNLVLKYHFSATNGYCHRIRHLGLD